MPNKSSNTGRAVKPKLSELYTIVRIGNDRVLLDSDGFVWHTENIGLARVQLEIIKLNQGASYRVVKILPDGKYGELDE